MSSGIHFAFRKVETPAFVALDNITLTSPVSEILAHGHVPCGWVVREKSGQWLSWNSHRELWYSYGKTRAEATEGMYGAPWHQFARPDPYKQAAA